ncbi:hypothetical protein FDUTEX481_00609 [Tolypothrix sp. PCC 7601]|nr:hypothetical protein FDUTEX481_00609 [Tolypothrix sp. PCC 7601]
MFGHLSLVIGHLSPAPSPFAFPNPPHLPRPPLLPLLPPEIP